ncbi:hypothetical protein CcaCcLH18_12742 [Colletotrichum camelliae]|nr:hypothetical protein CcaCcLH18_12742 [Colletotrichum camelliae]
MTLKETCPRCPKLVNSQVESIKELQAFLVYETWRGAHRRYPQADIERLGMCWSKCAAAKDAVKPGPPGSNNVPRMADDAEGASAQVQARLSVLRSWADLLVAGETRHETTEMETPPTFNPSTLETLNNLRNLPRKTSDTKTDMRRESTTTLPPRYASGVTVVPQMEKEKRESLPPTYDAATKY